MRIDGCWGVIGGHLLSFVVIDGHLLLLMVISGH